MNVLTEVRSGAMAVEVLASDAVLQAGVEATLRRCPEVTVVTTAAAVTVVVVDILDDAAMSLIRANQGRVLLVASSIDAQATLRAIEAGVGGVLRCREATADGLAAAVRAVSNGHGAMPPDLLGEIMDRFGTRSTPVAILDDREKAVLRMVADGHETAEIARTLAYSPRTVTGIVHDITRRLRLRNRAHAVAYALREGLI